MKSNFAFLKAVSLSVVVSVATAHAEIIMYDGVPWAKAGHYSQYYWGITDASFAFVPSMGSCLVVDGNADEGTTLRYPGCFTDAADIPQIIDDVNPKSQNRLINLSLASSSGGAAKVLTLKENCQGLTGTLHFRFLLSADAAALASMTADAHVAPKIEDVRTSTDVTESCGIIWSVDDYTQAAVNNSDLRYQAGYGIGASHNTDLDNKNQATIEFARGFMVGLHKDANGVPEIRLYAWGGDATSYEDDVRSSTLATNVEGGKTYVCYVQIDIGYYSNGDDRLRGMVQPTDGYSSTAEWNCLSVPIRAKLIGGDDADDLKAHLTLQGRNFGTGYIRFDEFGLATKRTDLVVWNPPKEEYSAVLAADGMPCGEGGYSSDQRSIGLEQNNVGTGFASRWGCYIGKSTIGLMGDGTGLSFPAPYSGQGILATAGTSIGPHSGAATQGCYLFRPFAGTPFSVDDKEVLNFRFLMSADKSFLDALKTGDDAAGALKEGTVGEAAGINYAGAGIADCSVQLESGSSHAPCLCRRANSCFFTFTKCSDGNVAIYLNLLTNSGDAQTAVKVVDVGEEGGTFLCYAQIEVGTGTNGKEKIRAFACDVSQVTDRVVKDWIPVRKGDAAIEFELIDSANGKYPRHAVVGTNMSPGFKFDEFALSQGSDQYPLVWAKYPPEGLILFFK